MSTHAREIYLDHAATTPLHPRAFAAMQECLDAGVRYGNPSSTHRAGRRAKALVERARNACAALLGASADELVFTSGATEADNLAIIGGARFRAHRGRHVITLRTEHKAVLASMDALDADGFSVTRLAPGGDGVLDPAELERHLRDDTQLVSVMHVNNETGVIQDIAASVPFAASAMSCFIVMPRNRRASCRSISNACRSTCCRCRHTR